MNRVLRSLIWMAMMTVMLLACKTQDAAPAPARIARVQARKIDRVLHYAGRIEPVDSSYIASPVNGFIDKMLFSYGDQVKKGQVLFHISDPKIESDFVDKVIEYLKSKDDLAQAKRKLSAEQDMLKAGIISEDDFIQKKTKYENAYITFAKRSIALRKVTHLVGASFQHIENLKLSDLNEIEKLLTRQSFVSVRANRSGRILSPNVVQGHGADKKKLVSIGSKVEKGQMLALSVQNKGFKVTLKVDEHEMNQIKPGMAVSLTAPSYGQRVLTGKVTDVHMYNMQKGSGSDEMVFPVTIHVATPSDKDMRNTYVGMHVKVAIHEGVKTLKVVPINAVFFKDNLYWLKVESAKGGIRDIQVQTGQTSAKDVVVQGKIKVGDQVLLHD